jgi:hypothetical protein
MQTTVKFGPLIRNRRKGTLFECDVCHRRAFDHKEISAWASYRAINHNAHIIGDVCDSRRCREMLCEKYVWR